MSLRNFFLLCFAACSSPLLVSGAASYAQSEICRYTDNRLSGSRLRLLFSVGRAPAIEWL